jgi:HD-GYP domain-containing protein (c-di-GMP phosphodiesterase class II)
MDAPKEPSDSAAVVYPDGLRELLFGFMELKRETGQVFLNGVSQDLAAARLFLSSIAMPAALPDQTVQVIAKVETLLEQALQRCRFLLNRLDSLEANGREINQMLDFSRQAANYAGMAAAYDATLLSLARAIDLRDREAEGHCERVTRLASSLARRLGMAAADLADFRYGVMLHDVGKLGVPEQILLKTEPLDETEWAALRCHPALACQMLGGIPYLAGALDVPMAHHERWDGSGYPLGLRGEQIPFGARIFAVVDVWDGVIHDRPQHSAWPLERASDYIRMNSGVQFDPLVVEEFLEMIREEAQNEN